MHHELRIDEPSVPGATIVLAHGAGAPMDSPFMDRCAAALAVRGLRVVRFEFPYMERRRTGGRGGGPDPQPILLQRWREVLDQLGGAAGLVIGGKSMGGRMASLIADEVGARGLVCLGYPFHPPGRPDRPRVAHLTELRTPTLIVNGERDTFGTPEEIARYVLSPAIRVELIADGDHSLAPRVRSGRTAEGNLAAAADHIAAFVARLPAR